MKIQYSRQALKFLKKQDISTRRRIVSAIEMLPLGDVKKLKGLSFGYRLRVGEYRVIFDYDGNIISIERIGNRGDIYK